MKEDFLHYCWKYQYFKPGELKTSNGELINVKSVGVHNTNAGPDFLNARLFIGDKEWAGNVEIHINSSDWYQHRHQVDKAYDSVILHVVYNHDKDVSLSDGSIIPVLELKDLLNSQAFTNYQNLINQPDWLACKNCISEIDSFTINSWMDRLITQRLENKVSAIEEVLKQTNGDWERVFYIWLAKYFGFKVNIEAFYQLALNIPFQLYSKYDKLFQIEALLFGQAGLLEKNFIEDYPVALQKEFRYLSKKHKIYKMDGSNWKFLRLRPANFPTIRLSQFARLIWTNKKLFSLVLSTTTVDELIKLLDTNASEYWSDRFLFDKPSKENKYTRLGVSGKRMLIINTIVPFLFAYGKSIDNAALCDRAIRLLEELPAEKNGIVDHFKASGVKSETAFSSQALIELSTNFCKNKNCLNCTIGNQLIKKNL
tara:strand:- start:5682 stop:6959 length:1278 start_codon:yes stop_codon:yes gene_type:complete